ncbi:MAG: dihydrolipoamide acetyltransferase family protein, partial [Rhodothermia bacterium]
SGAVGPSPGREASPVATAPAAGAGHVIEIVMPKMGESIMEGTVLAWFKKPGDDVDADESLLEIGTDKVDSEIPSPAAGVVKEILVEEGATVDVGTVLATLSPNSEFQVPSSEFQVPSSGIVQAKSGSVVESAVGGDGHAVAPDRRDTDGRFYSPLVRSIAKEEGISSSELEEISGSGRDGRLTKQDVLSFVAHRGTRPAGSRATVPVQPAGPSEQAPPGPVPGQVVPSDAGSRVEVVEMDRIRRVVAEHMTRSLATSAHVTSFAEADVTNLVRLRDANKAEFLEREGVKLTYTPFFVKASVDALREHPLLNSSVEGHSILVKKDFHIGIAVAIDKTGLVVPVIRFAGGMNVAGLAHAAADLADRARNKQLQPDELRGGSFTVTNVGSLGSIMGTPIINQPQVAVLATGAITKRAVVKEHPDFGDVIAVRNMVYLSLSYDHRIIDGAMAASFLQNVVSNLESIGPGYDL